VSISIIKMKPNLLLSISERLPLKMVILHIDSDDHTYVDGDMECEVDKDGEPIEPYIYKEEGRTVECYVSEHLYIEKKNNEITKVVHTATCWSDDYDKYDIENGEVVYLETTEHGMNRAYITYEDGVISEIKYARLEFGCYAVGDKAPLLKELI
jgi:hypothetical protein